jgi:N-acetylglucosaminyldiphosphoundecaprenol N-acetyl-beta-D-mannosaminyltransferase
MEYFNHFGYRIYSGPLNGFWESPQTLINTINTYSYCIAERDSDFKKALKMSSILLPDGVGIVIALKLFTGKWVKKIAGADVHKTLLTELNERAGTCFYLGASQETLQKIQERLNREYPNIKAGFYSPPYKDRFSEQENMEMIDVVNMFKPDVLFVGMTAPKQEKWAFAHKELLDAKIICSIGAVFDFYAGTVKRPKPIWINLGLEWFVRLVREPKRLWKRTLFYGPLFFCKILQKKLSDL